MDNPEKLATQGTQDEENQNKNTIKYVLDTKLFLSSSAKHLLKTGKRPTHIRSISTCKHGSKGGRKYQLFSGQER